MGGKIVDKFTAHVKLILVRRSAQTSLINGNASTHGGGDADFLDVHAFSLSRFCFFQRNQQSFQVFFQFISVKIHFTDGGVDDAVFVVTVTNLTCFSVLNRFSNVRRYGTHFRVLASGRADPEPGPAGQQTRIASRGSNNNVKVHFAFFDLVSQIFHTYQLCASSFSCFSVRALGKYGYAN
ncbi:Uncharacterised protein [Klebsiella michiganensis]|uniref:Uncharacterized protein n=1 Tax=Klebsiella michiganensis TaxID=1134687 RepID=A0A7H4PDT7_9ENTR|nr:Uncharacterised protein [Klebsiella michiganensis]